MEVQPGDIRARLHRRLVPNRVLLVVYCIYEVALVAFGSIRLLYVISVCRGDIDAHITNNTNHTYCVTKVYSYQTAFLFYFETETTIGYGTRAITEKCPEAIFLFIVQVGHINYYIQTKKSK